MEKREKNKNIIVLGIVMAISLSVALNIGNIFGGIGTFFKILNPIILGCMLAVIFNVPMEALSRQLERLSKKVKFLKKGKGAQRDKPSCDNSYSCACIRCYNVVYYSGSDRVDYWIYKEF